MKRLLLAVALSILPFASAFSQDCSYPPASHCDSAKFICGYALDGYTYFNYGDQPSSWSWVDLWSCGIAPHIPMYFKIVPCSENLAIEVFTSNCEDGHGLQLGLVDSCNGSVIACDPGFAGGANAPLLLEANVVPGQPYVFVIDGFNGDVCDFYVQVLEGLDDYPPAENGLSQPGYIEFQTLPCGLATLTAHFPKCQQVLSPPQCESGWTDFYVNNCLGFLWNLPPGVEIISPNPNAFTITIQFTQQVINGMVSVGSAHTCPGINENECPQCIPKCCKGSIPPIFISSPPSSFTYVPCEEAPTYCAGSLDEVNFNNGCSFGGFGWWQTALWSYNDPCFSLENPNLYRVIACDGQSNFSFEVNNCANGRGLEFRLMRGNGCGDLFDASYCAVVPEGQTGEFPYPFQFSPDHDYFLIVDGIDLDACDFKITEIPIGGNNNGQTQCLASQVTIDDYSPDWPFYTVAFDITHPDESFVTGDPGTYFPAGYFVSAPIPCDSPYYFEVHTGNCTQIISGNQACYLPPDCTNFNLPAPMADSCRQAPLLCGNYLDGFCSTTAGLTPDQPAATTDTIPEFENNGWLRITPCEDSIAIDFQVFDCQTGNELGFFLLSGTCDTMTLLTFISAQDGNVAHLTAGGLTPGEIYYLVVDGFYNAECKFQTSVVYGIGTASPGEPTCTCTDSYVDGPDNLCPADIVQYTLVEGACTITPGQPVGGNGIYCPPPPEVCVASQDSVVLHWTIPPFMHFLSDSINVNTITVQVDSSLLGFDTILTGTVSVYWEIIDLTDSVQSDTLAFCDCSDAASCVSAFFPKDVTVSHDVEYEYGVLTCVEPCYVYNGQSFCTAGEYVLEQTNCLTKELILISNIYLPFANAGPDQQICAGQSATIGGPPIGPYTYLWDNGATVSQQSVSPPATTTYILFVTDSFNGCTNMDAVVVTVNQPVDSQFFAGTLTCQQPAVFLLGNVYAQPGQYTVPKPNGCGNYIFTIDEDFTPPAIGIAPVPEICSGGNATLVATTNLPFSQFAWSNGMSGSQITVAPMATTTYAVTVTNPVNGCTNTASATVQVVPPMQTTLPPATVCKGDCVDLGGNIICPPASGDYIAVLQSYQGCDSTIVQTITVNDPPVVEAGQPQEICAGDTATLTATPNLPGVQFFWSNGATGAQIEVSPTATTSFSVIATDTNNGCSATADVIVTVDPSVDTDWGVAGTITCNQLTVNFLGNTYDQPGQYSVPKPSGCGNDNFIILEDVTPPWCPIIPVPPVCAGESATLQTGLSVPSDVHFLWNTGDTTQEINVTPLLTTTYSVTATNPANGCSSTVAIEVEVNQPQVVQLGTVGTLTCAQPCLTFNGQEYCQPGMYSITENCEIKEFQIGDLPPVWLELGEDRTIAAGEFVELQGQTNTQPAIVVWQSSAGIIPDSTLIITVQPEENTLFSLEIEDVNGCLLADSVWVFVEKAAGGWYAPNVFKPGSAGPNDRFTLFAGIDYVAEIQLLEIYDRWGNLVFSQKNFPPNVPDWGWDGKQNGKLREPAVFVWQAVLLLSDGATTTVKGDVTILR